MLETSGDLHNLLCCVRMKFALLSQLWHVHTGAVFRFKQTIGSVIYFLHRSWHEHTEVYSLWFLQTRPVCGYLTKDTWVISLFRSPKITAFLFFFFLLVLPFPLTSPRSFLGFYFSMALLVNLLYWHTRLRFQMGKIKQQKTEWKKAWIYLCS